ncbi:MAG: nitroreductase family deazaflavin-dependent oxidoreductase [Solirubrobacterales bacterium]
MAKLYGVIQEPLDRLVFRLTDGRTTVSSWMGNVKVTMLTATGVRSGEPRTTPVLGLPDGDGMILIASNFGRPRNPNWCHNVRANPRVEILFEGEPREMVARELDGTERDRAYARGEEVYPGFVHYKRWAGERRIPVFRLEPASV